MSRRQRRRQSGPAPGFTLPEILLSISLFSTMLVTVLSVFSTAQQNYFTSVGMQQAQLRTMGVLEEMRDDLIGARIEGYMNEYSGQGKVFVKFRRLSVGTASQPVASADDTMLAGEKEPIWEAQVRMYVWCVLSNEDADPPCNRITPRPEPDQLLLVRADPATNPSGLVDGDWLQERVVIGNMDATLGTREGNDPETYPFQLTIMNNAPTPDFLCRSPQPPDTADRNCGGHTCLGTDPVLGTGQECRYPFSPGSVIWPTEPDRVAGSITLRLLTAGKIHGLGGDRIIREDRRLSFRLRNPQEGRALP